MGNEKLAAVGLGPSVGHGKDSFFGVSQRIVKLIFKSISDISTSRTRWIPTLNHKILNDPVEYNPIVEFFVLVLIVHKWIFAFCQGYKVGYCNRGLFVFQLDDNISLRGLDIGKDTIAQIGILARLASY